MNQWNVKFTFIVFLVLLQFNLLFFPCYTKVNKVWASTLIDSMIENTLFNTHFIIELNSYENNYFI
jgi:hypothetical protein